MRGRCPSLTSRAAAACASQALEILSCLVVLTDKPVIEAALRKGSRGGTRCAPQLLQPCDSLAHPCYSPLDLATPPCVQVGVSAAGDAQVE